MKPFSFVHASDLHLDSPFKGVTAEVPQVEEALRSATFDTFDSLIQLCLEKEAAFLLIVGDVYDGADRSLKAQLKFLDGLKKLTDHNIASFVVHGNHDALDGWSSTIVWPDSVHVCGEKQVESSIAYSDGQAVALISGISYGRRKETRNLSRKFPVQDSDLFKIGMLHCNCGGNPDHESYAECSLQDLISQGFDYWALGHFHEKSILNEHPYVVYPGNTQGLSIKEMGARGCYYVSVTEDKEISLEFCQLDTIRWLTTEIPIDEFESLDALDEEITGRIGSLNETSEGRPVICRIQLTGRGMLYQDLRRENAVKELLERIREIGLSEEPFVWVQNIQMNCRPELDRQKRVKANDLLGQVLRISTEIQDAVSQERNELEDILIPALKQLYEDRRATKILDQLSQAELLSLLNEAELLCIDFLENIE